MTVISLYEVTTDSGIRISEPRFLTPDDFAQLLARSARGACG